MGDAQVSIGRVAPENPGVLKQTRVPAYVGIREALRGDIMERKYSLGQRLPSEDELAVRFGVSRMTARRAVADLAAEGLLVRYPGRGTFVGGPPKYVRRLNRLASYYEEMLALGHEPSSHVLSLDTLPCSPDVAAALDLAEGELAVVLERLRFADGIPMTIHRVHVPCALCPQLPQLDNLGSRSLYTVYRENGHAPARAHDRLEVALADEGQALLLGVPVGFPLWHVQRVTRDERGVAVEFLEAYTRSDRYVYEIDLVR